MADSSGGHFTCLHLQSISHFKQNNTTAQCSDRRLCLPAAAIAVNQTAALTKSVTAKKTSPPTKRSVDRWQTMESYASRLAARWRLHAENTWSFAAVAPFSCRPSRNLSPSSAVASPRSGARATSAAAGVPEYTTLDRQLEGTVAAPVPHS